VQPPPPPLERSASIIPDEWTVLVDRKLANPELELTEDESVKVLLACIKLGTKAARAVHGKQAIVLLGNTGAGKSTCCNYIHGCLMEKDSILKVIRVSADSPVDELMPVGHSNVSETVIPDVKRSNVKLPGAAEAALVDCPGQGDNRGACINIANAVNVKASLNAAASARIVVILNYHSLKADRARGLRELAQILIDLFGTVLRVMENIKSLLLGVSNCFCLLGRNLLVDASETRASSSLASSPSHPNFNSNALLPSTHEAQVTQVPKFNDDGDEATEVDTIRALVSNGSGLDASMTQVLGELAKTMFLYHPCDKGNSTWLKRDELVERIKSLPPVPEPDGIFQTVLNPSDEIALRRIVNAFASQARKALVGKRYDECAQVLRHMSLIECVGNILVTRLLAEARDATNRQLRSIEREATSATMREDFAAAEVHIAELRTIQGALVDADGKFLSGLIAVGDAVKEQQSFCDMRRDQKRQFDDLQAEFKNIKDTRKALEQQLGLLQEQQAANQGEIERMRKEKVDAGEAFRKEKLAMQESYAAAVAKVEEKMRHASEQDQKELKGNLTTLKEEMQAKIRAQDASAAKEKAVMEGMIKRYEEQLKKKDTEEQEVQEKLRLESERVRKAEEEKRKKEAELRKKDAATAALATATTERDVGRLRGAIRDAKALGVDTSRAERTLEGILKEEQEEERKKAEAADRRRREREAPRAAAAAPAVKKKLPPEEQKKVDKDLLTAALNGDEEGVRDLLARGANTNGYKDVR